MRFALLFLTILSLGFTFPDEAKTPYMVAVDKAMSTWPYRFQYNIQNYVPTETERIYLAKSASVALFLPDIAVDKDDPERAVISKTVSNQCKMHLFRYMGDIDVVDDRLKERINEVVNAGDPVLRPHAVDLLKVWRFRKLIP